MTRILLTLVIFVSQNTINAQQTSSWGDQGDGTYKNPVLSSNFPDNDVIRVKDTYYMISSTNHFVPGMVILKSMDLVNWEYSNHVMPAPITYSPEYNFKKGPTMENRGTWAGSLGYNGEHYFCYWVYNTRHLMTSKEDNKNLRQYFSKSKHIEGPWSEPKEITFADGAPISHTDPGVFFDMDTKEAWLAAGSKIFKMSWDGERLLVNEKDGIHAAKQYHGEAAKIYKMNGWYYFMNAHWTTHDGVRQRMGAIHRSKKMDGPWEGKLVLENGNGTDRCPSQGALLKLDDGSYWFLHQLARGEPDVRYNGRPQFLEPVKFIDGWPLIGVDTDGDGIGEVVWQHKKPITGFPITAIATNDDFSATKLGQQWYWRFNPRFDRFSLSERPGWLRMKSTVPLLNKNGESLDKLPNLLSQRSIGRYDNVLSTKFDLSGMTSGQESGFHISSRENNVIGVKKDENGKLNLFFKYGKPDNPTVINGPTINQNTIWFRATIENGLANFFYSLDGEKYESLGIEVRLVFSGFTTNGAGFYSKNTTESGYVDIDWFTYDYDGPKGASK